MSAARSILWLANFQAHRGFHHGAPLRWFNLSRELVARGHRVCFSVNCDESADADSTTTFLEQLRRDGWLTAYEQTFYRVPRRRGRLAHGLALPPLTNLVLSPFQKAIASEIDAMISRHEVDTVLVGDRRFLFLGIHLGGRIPVINDWSDSTALYEWRQAVWHLWQGRLGEIPRSIQRLTQAALNERYYARRASANLAVSPVDVKVLRRLAGGRAQTHLLMNGVERPAPAAPGERIPDRLIFTGAMSYAPNHDGAMWFIDRVLPRVLAHRPGATFVVAGREPRPELRSRAGDGITVTGVLADLVPEIRRSSLFVAPILTGSGFRNKVTEALAAGVFVAGTRRAVEFLPDLLQRQLLTGDTETTLAEAVVSFLASPEIYDARVPRLRRILDDEYTWSRRAEELLRVIEVAAQRPVREVVPS